MPTDNEWLRLIYAQLANGGSAGGSTDLAKEATLQQVRDYLLPTALAVQELLNRWPDYDAEAQDWSGSTNSMGDWVEVMPFQPTRVKWFIQNPPDSPTAIEVGYGDVGYEFVAFELSPGGVSHDFWLCHKGRIVVRSKATGPYGSQIIPTYFYAHELFKVVSAVG